MIQSDIICIIGGGPSAKLINYDSVKKHSYLLGVNDSAFNQDCHGVFSMDGAWLSNRWQQAKALDIDCFFRLSAYAKHVGIEHTWDKLELIRIDPYSYSLSEIKGRINGRSSGFCALNYAVLCKPKAIYLFGFDLRQDNNKRCHWYKEYEWSPKGKPSVYPMWRWDFENAAKQCRTLRVPVYNVSNISLITGFEVVEPRDFKSHFGRIYHTE